MMDKLIQEVTELVEREYGRASAKFGCTNNSDHESYAVLLEECEEAEAEYEGVQRAMAYLWALIKKNDADDTKFEACHRLQKRAMLAACEFIQVAAMAKKAAMTVGDRNVVLDLTGAAGDPE